MNRLLFTLRRLIAVPIEMIGGPLGLTNSVFDESSKGRSLILGLPAIAVGILGLSLVVWAFFGNKDRLERQYDLQAEKYLEELQTIRSSLTAAANDSEDVLEAKKEEFETTRQTSLIYLNKLISIDPENNEYQFKLATTTFLGTGGEDKSRGIELMQNIAPEDAPGYAPAHLWLARLYVSQLLDPKRRTIRSNVASKVLKHLNYCLDREPNNKPAIAMRAELLQNIGRINEAYEGFKKLFETNPFIYRSLYAIDNARLESGTDLTTEEKTEFVVGRKTALDGAKARINDRINEMRADEDSGLESKKIDQSEWIQHWQALVDIHIKESAYEEDGVESFVEIIEELQDEKKRVEPIVARDKTPAAASRLRAVNALLVSVYLSWSDYLGTNYDSNGIRVGSKTMAETPVGEQLDQLEKALKIAPNNKETLSRISSIVLSKTEFSARAKDLYDPETDPNPPSTVLSQLGNLALQAADYEKSIEYFDQARQKAKNDPTILNNLAYAYLVKENPDPDQALNLVNEALRMLSRFPPAYRSKYISNFFDTRGNALLQMKNPEAAVQAFLRALETRPKNIGILEGVIEAYNQLGNEKQANVYKEMLEKAKAEEEQRKSAAAKK